jgi:hypothetical protein
MIPKIIHNIWIQGYENLPNEKKINYLNIKKKNPDWEFIIWDDDMIKKLLKKYPDIYELYTKNIHNAFVKDSIKSDIARYIIMKEYGGLYYDIEFKCMSSFNDLFLNNNPISISKNIVYIATSKTNMWNYIYSLQKLKYSSSFMAMDKNHPIWDIVIQKLKRATTKYEIHNALDIALQQSEDKDKSFPILLLDKINGQYQCTNNDTICYKPEAYSWNSFSTILKYINCYYKQIILFIVACIIIVCVEYLYMHNTRKYGVVNFIPGMPGSTTSPSNPILQKKKDKSKR